MDEFDQHFTCKLVGYKSPTEYYQKESCIHSLMDVSVPLCLVNALDDPLVLSTFVPLDAPRKNSNLILITTQHGGHLGWSEGWILPSSYWHERFALQCIRSIVSVTAENNKGRQVLEEFTQ